MEVQQQQAQNVHGLIFFNSPNQKLTPLQQKMAKGHRECLTIDWGDFQRQEWKDKFSSIREITAKTIMLRNNRYSSILKDLPNISFSKLVSLDLTSNNIRSLQFLPQMDAPDMKQLNLSSNQITTIRSLIKAKFANIENISLKENPLTDLQNLFKGHFVKLNIFALDQSGDDTRYKFWRDPVLWRVKNAPVLVKEAESMSRARSFRDVTYGQTSVGQLRCRKYLQMIRQKPRYYQIEE